jgi:hypothetical protein
MNKSIVVALGSAIVGALTAFGFFRFIVRPAAGPPGPCPGGDRHCIEVSVITVNGQSQIAPIPDHDVHDPGATISWMIATPGYTFPNNGIAFDKTGNPPSTSTEFINLHRVGNGTFRCTDRKNALGTFGYTVRLDGFPAVAPLDPFIVNR